MFNNFTQELFKTNKSFKENGGSVSAGKGAYGHLDPDKSMTSQRTSVGGNMRSPLTKK